MIMNNIYIIHLQYISSFIRKHTFDLWGIRSLLHIFSTLCDLSQKHEKKINATSFGMCRETTKFSFLGQIIFSSERESVFDDFFMGD